MHDYSNKPFISSGRSENNIWRNRNVNIVGKWIHVTAVYRKDRDCFMYLDNEKSELKRKEKKKLKKVEMNCL